MKIAPHFDPKIIHIEGIEVFDKSDINRVLSEVSRTFKSSPKKISNLDENENPSKRTVELEPGIWTGLNNNFGRDDKENKGFQYLTWELPKGEFQDFIKYANDRKPLDDCREKVVKDGFIIVKVEDSEIACIAQKLKWIAATAYFDELTHILTLHIRINYIPPPNGNQLRRNESVLEKSVEMYFLELKGFSYKISPCLVPSVPKVVSLSVLASDHFMVAFDKLFDGAIPNGAIALDEEILDVLRLIGYDGAGYPTVIRESKNLFQVIWQGGLARDGRTFYFVDFTDLEKFIVERLKHSLPQRANIIKGNTVLISDILDYDSIWFSFLYYYQAIKLEDLKKDYVKVRTHLYEKFRMLSTKKYNEIFLALLTILASLQKYQADLDDIYEWFSKQLTVRRGLSSPELAVSQFNIFGIDNLIEIERGAMPLTFSRSLILLRKRKKTNINLELTRLTESVEKTIALLSSRIQAKETRLNTYIIVMTLVSVLVAIITLFRFKF